MNEIVKFFNELKEAGFSEVELIERTNIINLTKCKKRELELGDFDDFGIKNIILYLGDNFNFKCIECDEIYINAGNNCTIHIQEGDVFLTAGNNCTITLVSGRSLIIGNNNNLECCDIDEIKFGNHNIIKVEELICKGEGGNDNSIIIEDSEDEIKYKKTKMKLKENNKVKIGKMEMEIE